MRFKDIIWPWGALREARILREADNAYFLEDLVQRETALIEARAAIRAQDTRLTQKSLRIIELLRELDKANDRHERLVRIAHFRDPVTGRIGQLGKVPTDDTI